MGRWLCNVFFYKYFNKQSNSSLLIDALDQPRFFIVRPADRPPEQTRLVKTFGSLHLVTIHSVATPTRFFCMLMRLSPFIIGSLYSPFILPSRVPQETMKKLILLLLISLIDPAVGHCFVIIFAKLPLNSPTVKNS